METEKEDTFLEFRQSIAKGGCDNFNFRNQTCKQPHCDYDRKTAEGCPATGKYIIKELERLKDPEGKMTPDEEKEYVQKGNCYCLLPDVSDNDKDKLLAPKRCIRKYCKYAAHIGECCPAFCDGWIKEKSDDRK